MPTIFGHELKGKTLWWVVGGIAAAVAIVVWVRSRAGAASADTESAAGAIPGAAPIDFGREGGGLSVGAPNQSIADRYNQLLADNQQGAALWSDGYQGGEQRALDAIGGYVGGALFNSGLYEAAPGGYVNTGKKNPAMAGTFISTEQAAQLGPLNRGPLARGKTTLQRAGEFFGAVYKGYQTGGVSFGSRPQTVTPNEQGGFTATGATEGAYAQSASRRRQSQRPPAAPARPHPRGPA